MSTSTSLSTKPFFWVFVFESLFLLAIVILFHQQRGVTIGVAAAAIYIFLSFIKQCWLTKPVNNYKQA